MVELIVVGFIAGVVAGISPCILPVLPVVFAVGATTPQTSTDGSEQARRPVENAENELSPPAVAGTSAARSAKTGDVETTVLATNTDKRVGARPSGSFRRWWSERSRAVSVAIGLVLSFSLLILAGSEIISLLHLPEGFLKDAGIAVLLVLGVGLLVPKVGEILEKPFAGVGSRQPSGQAGGFVVGLALGLVFTPCAGPILAAITVVGATHRVGLTSVFLTVAFAVGAAVPLLVVAIAGSELAQRSSALRRNAPRVRQLSGVVLIVIAITIGFNAFVALQRDVPGYTSALQTKFEGSSTVRKQLSSLTQDQRSSLANCNPDASGLVNCGKAPNFRGITAWLNTPGDKPLSLPALRGHVVLVDFWTYSCINCQRTLPHVEAWYRNYSKDGFIVVGVHTPEFDFEHVVSNVRSEASQLGVRYPVAIDDDYSTWDAYDNEYWPADYLIDAQGDVRHVHFGEGDYANTESLVRELLIEAHPGVVLPRATDVPDDTPLGEMSPETYVGYRNEEYLDPPNSIVPNSPALYEFPTSLPVGAFALSGTWTEDSEEATAGSNAKLELAYLAQDVYLVLAGTGTLDVSVDGHNTETIDVSGVPRLYTLVHGSSEQTGTLLLRFSSGVEAYDFTFG